MTKERAIYYVLADDGKTPIPVGTDLISMGIDGILKHAEWMATAANRVVDRTDVPGGVVSTVFLGTDARHFPKGPPMLWETAFFKDDGIEKMRRYSTYEEAVAGHQAMVEELTH